jgi:hypothetical protein
MKMKMAAMRYVNVGISPNVVEEALTEISMVGGGEEGMCESQLFSDRGLVSVLLDAVDYFKKGALYEISVEARARSLFTCRFLC